MRGIDGGTSGVVIVGRNLVEQREMEAQMQQAEKLAASGFGHWRDCTRNPQSARRQLRRGAIAEAGGRRA